MLSLRMLDLFQVFAGILLQGCFTSVNRIGRWFIMSCAEGHAFDSLDMLTPWCTRKDTSFCGILVGFRCVFRMLLGCSGRFLTFGIFWCLHPFLLNALFDEFDRRCWIESGVSRQFALELRHTQATLWKAFQCWIICILDGTPSLRLDASNLSLRNNPLVRCEWWIGPFYGVVPYLVWKNQHMFCCESKSAGKEITKE